MQCVRILWLHVHKYILAFMTIVAWYMKELSFFCILHSGGLCAYIYAPCYWQLFTSTLNALRWLNCAELKYLQYLCYDFITFCGLKLINLSFFHSEGFNLYPPFPAPTADFPQGAVGPATPEHQKLQLDPNTSIKTEYMSFPPPLQRSPLNTTTERRYTSYICLWIH